MLVRIVTGLKPSLPDMRGRALSKRLAHNLGLLSQTIRVNKVYTIDGLTLSQAKSLIAQGILHDPILQEASVEELLGQAPYPDWLLEIAFRPGVTDNEGRTAKEAIALALGIPKETVSVYTARQYRIWMDPAHPLDENAIKRMAMDGLANPLIERVLILPQETWLQTPGFPAKTAKVTGTKDERVESIALRSMDDQSLAKLSRDNTWALSVAELSMIRDHFADPSMQEARKKLGMPTDPTDVEMEVLAQTWSEHCKHKIFAADITYTDTTSHRTESVANLYKSCIRDTTKTLRERMGDRDFCKSVFSDNAGVIAFINSYDACIKVETHNSPSALDPYGGALTGIVGVNRDPMGTGMGAELVCNTDVFCFASPFYAKAIPPRLLHPRRVLDGVREGVEHGGNKSGIPTVNGSLIFDDRYLGKPLVYCGTVGILPTSVNGKPGWVKKAQVGDIIVMVGGSIGKDGIHGATFSSEELHEGSPATAVQIGDPITQRKMYDCLIRARDLGLYTAITDNGAGGLSSSVGEMAQDTGGCELDIACAPLKYDGLRPWEILLSEAQERMTIAVPKDRLEEFLALAKHMDVQATPLGHFTDSGYFLVTYAGKPIARLDMAFMHEGVPTMHLGATWTPPKHKDERPQAADCGDILVQLLGSLAICSKEAIIRQYDHEVKGGSVIKPLVGVCEDAPSDAAVVRPVLESDAGLVIAHGICPKWSDYDTYWMVANAMDEAIRNAVCVGASPDALALVDNFCWCDPIQSEKNPDGDYKLAQLVRACKALRHFALAYGTPCISGKDSMKNDYIDGTTRIAIPPTVLLTSLGVIPNVLATQTSDFKQAGDLIYILGGSWREFGGSEAAKLLGLDSKRIPFVDAQTALPRYRALHSLIRQRIPTACHDCSDGGLGVCIAEMCIGGRLGASLILDQVPCFEPMNECELLFGESASRIVVTVRPEAKRVMDILAMEHLVAPIGVVEKDPTFSVSAKGKTLFRLPVDTLVASFTKTLAI
ncbi:MAG: phosphoribosylformylglycinamidine synthase [Desulfovibrio sp.]|nr:phosphoribosylformylglycinamidine synthase [Desulfovibrio sp.]